MGGSATSEVYENAMADIDKLGFRIGSKRSMAASLYERGATQAEMVAATGTTQYNMLKDAERRGHHVVVNGDRHWLIAATSSPSGSGATPARQPRQSPCEVAPRPSVRRATRVDGNEMIS